MKQEIEQAIEKMMERQNMALYDRFPWAQIGEFSYGGLDVARYDDTTRLKIGAYCSFAHGTKIILGGEHRTDWATTFPFPALWPEAKAIEGHPKSKGDVEIGNDVWMGADSVVLSGVKVGDGAVIAAGAIVFQSVSPYMVVAGNPAKPLMPRFRAETVERLLKIRWWEWGRGRIVKALPFMLNTNIEKFLQEVEGGKL